MPSNLSMLTARVRPRSGIRSGRLARLAAGLGLPVLIMTVAVSTTQSSAQAPVAPGASANQTAAGATVFLSASLNGRNEVPTPGGPAVGDPDGRAESVVRIQGNQVCFFLHWAGITAPIAGHIHAGAAGVNGPVRVLFFGTPLPATFRLVAGCTAVDDAALVEAIKSGPQNFYVNVHTAQFEGGAVRAQLRPANPADLQVFVRGNLAAVGDGTQEVPTLGDLDGRLTGFITATLGRVHFAVTFSDVTGLTLGHIHAGAFGVAGPVVVPLFDAPGGLPPTLFAFGGFVTGVNPTLIATINRNPAGFYINLHNDQFSAGAVRAQLFDF